MKLKDQIANDMKQSMKDRDKQKTSTLRMLLSDLKYAQAATNIHEELGDDAALKVTAAFHKRLVKSLADYPEGEMKSQLETEIKIVDVYLPKKATQEETLKIVEEVLSGTEERNFGVLMKQVLSKLGNQADGKVVSQLLKSKIS